MNIDLLNPRSFAQGHPFDQYEWLREHAPVYWHEEPDGPGFWAVTRYEDVVAVGRDPNTFSSEPTIMIADPAPGSGFAFGDHKMMLMMDPPDHTRFRKIISREFTQGPAAALRPRIETLSKQIVDAVMERGECDFVADVAGELPSFVIAELMGMPLEDGRKLYALTETIHSAPEMLPEGAQLEAVTQMFQYAEGLYRQKLERPDNDLASQIVHAEVEGQRLDLMDFQLFFPLLIDAGGDTTRNLVAGGLYTLLQHPDVPAEIAGQKIRSGDKAVRCFGAGTHVCLGQHIARVEIDCMLAEVLGRLHDIELTEPPEWLASNFISGIRRMPIRFEA